MHRGGGRLAGPQQLLAGAVGVLGVPACQPCREARDDGRRDVHHACPCCGLGCADVPAAGAVGVANAGHGAGDADGRPVVGEVAAPQCPELAGSQRAPGGQPERHGPVLGQHGQVSGQVVDGERDALMQRGGPAGAAELGRVAVDELVVDGFAQDGAQQTVGVPGLGAWAEAVAPCPDGRGGHEVERQAGKLRAVDGEPPQFAVQAGGRGPDGVAAAVGASVDDDRAIVAQCGKGCADGSERGRGPVALVDDALLLEQPVLGVAVVEVGAGG